MQDYLYYLIMLLSLNVITYYLIYTFIINNFVTFIQLLFYSQF